MMTMTFACPLCGHERSSLVHSVKDHTVSGEVYPILRCSSCGFTYTGNVPGPDQIGKYYASDAYISHTDNKKGLFNSTYQLIRRFSMRSKRKLVVGMSGVHVGNILDYGCGTGSFLHTMKMYGWKATGIEADPGARQKASQLAGVEVLEPKSLSAFPDHSFDVITLWHVLEHVHDLHQTIEQFRRILKPKGLLFIAVPNHTAYDASHYGPYWAAYDVPRHLYHFDPASMKSLLSRHGLRLLKWLPMWFDAFYVALLSEQYKKGNTRILPAIITGLVSNINAFFKPALCSSLIYVASKDQS